ncbi:MAG: AbrB/MazE/SpoVT family DNA-binding domain-containing protein [Chromatiaceae bacterium]
MPTVTASDKGQVVIPAEIRRRLGIVPGCQLDFSLDGNAIRAEVRRHFAPSKAEDGFGMLVCKRTGERRLSEFDVAQAMREASDDRP